MTGAAIATADVGGMDEPDTKVKWVYLYVPKTVSMPPGGGGGDKYLPWSTEPEQPINEDQP